jgi:protoporphyrinogen oxidase
MLSKLGYRAVLLEKASHVGGVDGSFFTPGGTRFDIGLHVLDYMRSELATKLFTHVVDGQVNRLTLKRAICLRNHIMPYAPRPEEMPEELREMLLPGELVDDIGDEIPTRARLAQYYGARFTDFVFDEVLPSYRSEVRHKEFGVDESKLLGNVYPWLFPRANRRAKSDDESRTYHDRLRDGFEQEIIYPKEGCFGGFAEGFARHLDRDRIEVLTEVDDLQLELRPGTHTVDWVGAKGRRFSATHVFWAAPWGVLCGILDIPCQAIASDRVMLGSFRLNRPAKTDYHEILVGDPKHRMNRVFFPSVFRGSDEPLMQIEQALPFAEDWPLDSSYWLETWLEDTKRMGLLDDDHRVEEFDFRSFPKHFNAYGVEGEILRDADPSLIRADSNLRPVTPSLANLNLNRHVQRDVSYVASVLAESPGSLSVPDS